MTDSEINAIICEKVMGWTRDSYPYAWIDKLNKRHFYPNFVIDPSHMILLMSKLGISIIHSDDGWYAMVASDIVHHGTSAGMLEVHGYKGDPQKNPTRAVALAALASVGSK